MAANNLPPGFEIETPQNQPESTPGLPPGFEIEQQSNDFVAKSNAERAQYEQLQAKEGNKPIQAALLGAAHTIAQPYEGPKPTISIGGKEESLLPEPLISPERQRDIMEANPIASTVGTGAALMTPGGLGTALSKAGEMAASHVVGEGVLKGMQRGAVKLAAENALYQTSDETAKMMRDDPNQSLGSAVTNIGLAAVLGGGLGAIGGATSPLWKAANESKVGGIANDFKARMQEHLGIEASAPEAMAPETVEAYDPFTKEKRMIVKSEGSPQSSFDPFTKKEVPSDATPMEASKEMMPQPYEPTPVSSPTHQKYDEVKSEEPLSAGEKLADALVKKSHDYLSSGVGASIGAAVGHMTGIPGAGALGALIGERSVGPFLKSVLPGMAKSILEKIPSGEGLKTAVDYGMSIARGIKQSENAVKSLFSSGSKLVIPESTRPSPETRKKLDVALETYQKDPARIANLGGSVGHYLPEHATAIGSMASNAVSFLNSIKPQTSPKAPLDSPRVISTAVQSQYDRALDIAQQPLIVFDSIKDGTFTSHDVMALNTLYPQLYAGLRQKVMNQIVEHKANGGVIPYDTRLGLSMFLQQPLDSTMQPQAIAAAQPAPQPPQQAPSGPKKVSQGAASTLNKGAKMAQTQTQASEAMHVSGGKA